eukprot:m.34884 g.34884  ORF g.34884 m.34884 type:complete len:66 (+) comp9557_c0_seq2:2534-2731(+)
MFAERRRPRLMFFSFELSMNQATLPTLHAGKEQRGVFLLEKFAECKMQSDVFMPLNFQSLSLSGK